MNLHLVLTNEWYSQVESGNKNIEYRKMTTYWERRIWKKRAEIKTVTFSKGYTKTKLTFKVVNIDIGNCPYQGWAGDFYRIFFK